MTRLQLDMVAMKRIRGMAIPMRELMRTFELLEGNVEAASEASKQFVSDASVAGNHPVILEAKRLLGTCMFTQAMTKKLKPDQTRQGDQL